MNIFNFLLNFTMGQIISFLFLLIGCYLIIVKYETKTKT